MAITELQRQRRRNYVGSSDCPAILGLSPWSNPSKIYYSKVAEPDEEDQPNEAMLFGTAMEPAVLFLAEQRLRQKLTRKNTTRVKDFRACNVDAWLDATPGVAVEAKLTTFPDDWGPDGTDQIPVHVLAQVQHQMEVAGLQGVWVAAMIVQFRVDFRMYWVPRCDALIEQIVDAEADFWNNHVLKRVPPSDDPPPLSYLKSIKRIPDKMVPIAPELVAEWQEAKANQKYWGERSEELQRQVLEALGDGEFADYGGEKILRYGLQKGQIVTDTDALRADGLFDKYCTQREHRVLREIKRK